MNIRDRRSIIVIFVYLLINAGIIFLSLRQSDEIGSAAKAAQSLAPEYTHIEDLDYFHLKNGIPQMSLSADKMRSQGEDLAEFEFPKGVYNYQEKNQTLKYQASFGVYEKKKDKLSLDENVIVTSDEAQYYADKVRYYLKKDLITGSGNVKFIGLDLKTKDKMTVESNKMRANPQLQKSTFEGNVRGKLERKRAYEGKTIFQSRQLQFNGLTSLAQLEGDVLMQRQNYLLTGGKADIYLENYNKSLKYFVVNDDVKMTETMRGPEGTTQRKAYAERLEGFGQEQKMVLSGAPRLEQGKDVVKGYRITLRENVDLIEVDDAMSDMEVKKKDKKLKE